jgi:hypothetical protein
MPGIPFPPSAGGAPIYKGVAGTAVGANTELSDVVPAGKWWWLISVTVSMVQGATQTPQPILQIDDGTINIFSSVGATGAMTASTTAQFSWGVGLVVSALIGTTPNIVATGPLPEFLILKPGSHIKTLTPGLGANSAYGTPRYYVCEFTP